MLHGGDACPEPWKPHARHLDPFASKALVTGTIPAASARGCSELLHPHDPRRAPRLCSGWVGTLRTRTATWSRTMAPIPSHRTHRGAEVTTSLLGWTESVPKPSYPLPAGRLNDAPAPRASVGTERPTVCAGTCFEDTCHLSLPCRGGQLMPGWPGHMAVIVQGL